MALRMTLTEAMKDAMRAKAADRLSVLRMINAAIKDRDIAVRGEGRPDGIDDPEVLALMGKMVKQRQESARVYVSGARPELAAKELAEVAVIEEFLPRRMDAGQVAAAIEAAVTEAGASGIKDMGKVMAVLKAQYTGQMDFGAVGPMVKARLG